MLFDGISTDMTGTMPAVVRDCQEKPSTPDGRKRFPKWLNFHEKFLKELRKDTEGSS